MRRHLLFATILAAAFSVGASAQSGTGQAGQAGQAGTMAQSAPGAEKQAKDQNVTVTGCIQTGTQSPSTPAGTSGSSAATGSPTSAAEQFVLANITGAPAPLSGMDRVSLSGKDSDLKKHLGHKVEITGKLEKPSTPPSPSSTAGTSGSSETLKVSSIKMLAESCSVQ
ncbi:MAG TPA: hypothetical protein VH138_09090, partial [Vicinamibacterales bacterium]|nr:hypothetical protein [Vicinamibacterales bacterium]